MEIRITKTATKIYDGDEAGTDNHVTYTISGDGPDYQLVKRSHGYGGNYYLPDDPAAHVYIVEDHVERQWVRGMTPDGFDWTPTKVEQLSINPIVIKVLKYNFDDITLTTEHSASSYGQPVVIDHAPWRGEPGQINEYMTADLNNIPV